MNILLLIITIISIALTVVLSLILFLHNSQLDKLINEVNFIRDNETNSQVQLDVQLKKHKELANSINKFLEKQKLLKQKEEKTNKLYRETITSVSHDLRTPLTSAMGYLQMLDSQNICNEKKQEYIQIVEGRIKSVNNLINQLFEFSRLELDQIAFNMKTMNINNILRNTVAMFYEDFLNKGINPEIDIPDTGFYAIVDEEALTRVFENIISNALHYSEQIFKVVSSKKEDSFEISFYNEKGDINIEDLSNIFERFYTIDKSRNKKTTGLGLSIAKKFVENMHGEIEAGIDNDVFYIRINLPQRDNNMNSDN